MTRPQSLGGATPAQLVTAFLHDREKDLKEARGKLREQEARIATIQYDNTRLQVQVASLQSAAVAERRFEKAGSLASVLGALLAALAVDLWKSNNDRAAVVVIGVATVLVLGPFVLSLFRKSPK